MIAEQLIANYTPAGDIITFVFCCILQYIIAKALFFSNDKKFIFLRHSLGFTTLGAWCNIAFYFIVQLFGDSIFLIYLTRDLYHFSLLFSIYCFMLYMKHMIDEKRTFENVMVYCTRVLFCICVLLDILSPVTKIGLHRENGLWYDSIVSPYNAFYLYSFILLFLILIFYSKRIIRYVRTCLGVTGLVIGAIMTYQGIMNINTFTSYTYVLPVFVVMILLHSKPFDDKTGALDPTSFDSFIKQSVKRKMSVDFVVLKLNVSMLDTLPRELGKVLNSFWHDSFREALSFKLTSDIFVLSIPKERKNGDTEKKVNDLINNYLYKCYEQYKIPYKLIGMFDVDFIQNLTDILGITSYLLSIMDDNTVLILNDKQKAEHRIMKQVKENLADIEIKNDLDDPRVLVYYQPVRNMKTGEFDTAEALMRLQLDGIGVVMPYLFITMAEEYGYINILTRIMINKVSKQLKQLESEGYYIKRVSVNVSAVDMKIDGFCEDLLEIIKKNELSTSTIGIELTESRTDRDFEILNKKMKILRDAGISLYLDDVGTGYSNLDRIVQYDVDVVKFDRFFLLEAEKSMKNVKMMSHLSQAFQDLEYKLLFEGVETDAHEALCMNCGADYIQGFKYSKPIPFDDFKKYLTLKGHQSSDSSKVIVNSEIKKSELIGKRDFTYKEIQDQYSILITMSKLFYSMHVIDLVNNTAKPYNPTDDIKVKDVVNSTMGADEMMRQIMRMCTVDEYVDAVLEFSNLLTIADRMVNKKILSAEFVGKSIGWYVASFYTIEADDNGKPTKMVFTTRSIDEEKKQKEKLIADSKA